MRFQLQYDSLSAFPNRQPDIRGAAITQNKIHAIPLSHLTAIKTVI